MQEFANPKKPAGLCFTYNLIDKRKISVLSEKSVGVETPTYGDYRLSSNRKVSKRKFFVLTEKTARAETPVPTYYTRQRLETIAKTEFLRTMPAPFSNLRKKKGSRLPV